MSDYDDLLGSATTWYPWSSERFDKRKSNIADVWERRSDEDCKEFIALLVAHAPESISEPTCQWPTEKFK